MIELSGEVPQKAIKVFFCYANEDRLLSKELENQLRPLRKERYITGWFSFDILAGTEWACELETRLYAASIILLFVSPDFVASDYLYDKQMQIALEQHRMGKAYVIPIIVRPVDWKTTPLGHLEVLPVGGKPVTLWGNRDQVWLDVTYKIKELIKVLLVKELLSKEETARILTRAVKQPAISPLRTASSDDDNRIVLKSPDVLEEIFINSKTLDEWRKEGRKHFRAHRYELALYAYQQVIQFISYQPYRTDADHRVQADAYHAQASVLQAQHRYSEALIAIEEALKLTPGRLFLIKHKKGLLRLMKRSKKERIKSVFPYVPEIAATSIVLGYCQHSWWVFLGSLLCLSAFPVYNAYYENPRVHICLSLAFNFLWILLFWLVALIIASAYPVLEMFVFFISGAIAIVAVLIHLLFSFLEGVSLHKVS